VPRPHLELGPDALVGPVFDLLGDQDLEVQARDLAGAHRLKREPVRVTRVDEFVHRRPDAGRIEPAELVLVVERRDDAVEDRRPADAVEAVAAGDEVTLDLLRRTSASR
jgi:hypothetical protein